MSTCQAHTPSTVTGWPVYCTLELGHTGDHEAWFTSTLLERWESLTPV